MKKYFIYENQQQAGPFTFEELASKNIKAETPVWFEGLADWQRADQQQQAPQFSVERCVSAGNYDGDFIKLI